MENSLVTPRSGGRSRFSKALPAPPPQENPRARVVRPIRKDSLPSASRPALPPKDTNSSTSIPSNMATKVMEAPLPRLPALSRVNSPPTVMPKRKPVGGGASIKSVRSPPPPPAAGSGQVSPTESFSSLLSAYGTEDSSAARYSVDTTATKHSFTEPSPPKLPPKDGLGAVNNRLERLDIVSPLFLPTPLSSKMELSQQQPETSPQTRRQGDRPPTPSRKDSQRSTDSQPNNQSPSHPQLWRRRSLKSDKPLAVPELKLISSHGSTASPQQVSNSVNNGQPMPNPAASSDGASGDSPTLNGFDANLLGQTTGPSPSQSLSPRNPSQDKMGSKKSKESLDGFSKYAQEVEDSIKSDEDSKAAQYSPAKLSPGRPPTPEYAQDEARSDDPAIYSPVSPMTPPDDPRPLSIIQESPEIPAKAPMAAFSSDPQPGYPPRGSSRSAAGAAAGSPAGPARPHYGHYGTNRSSPLGTSLPVTAAAGRNNSPSTFTAGLAPSPAIQAAANSSSPAHMRSTSAASVPTIEVTDDGDASTIKAPASPRPTTSSTMTTAAAAPVAAAQKKEAAGPPAPGDYADLYSTPPMSPNVAQPGDPTYFPMRVIEPVAPGSCIRAAPLKQTQLECFGGHYRFLASRNEDHPVACQSCRVEDKGARFTCAHCAVRICADCREVLMMNGRDLEKLVEMLKK